MLLACLPGLFLLGFVILILVLMSVRVVKQYERGVVLTLGKFTKTLEPGLNFVIPFIQQVYMVDTRITTIDIPKQEVMTKDNVPVYINAVVYMRVEDPVKAVLKIAEYKYAVAQYGQTALRDVIGNKSLDELLTNRQEVADEIKDLVDKETAEWGIDITAIKIQDITLPDNMKRAMARQAEAERERRSRIIMAEGEYQASQKMAVAAKLYEKAPAAMRLRELQTLAEIAREKNLIVVPGGEMGMVAGLTQALTRKTQKK